ncbi:MAG: CARDB domain-containing protein, partial [Anaerolineae bacterium]
TYTVNSANPTPPVIVVSYSDPQGSHRFITPVELPSLDTDLAPYAGQMLQPLGLEIATIGPVNANGSNTTNLVVNSPHPAAIQSGHLYVDFVADGTVVLHQEHTLPAIPPGPTVFPVIWATSAFTQTYDPAADNILLAHWTDSEGNIIDSAARPLNSFAADPTPGLAMAAADETWDFGAVAQGTVLKRRFTLANTGQLDLLTYVSAPSGLSVSQTGSRRIAPSDMTTYDIALNTADLPVGQYDQTITIRTSDPANSTRMVHVVGTITAAPADTPVDGMQRPLDWPATVSGTQGQWVEFTHTLGPDPQTLHPVKVYSQDYGTLKGVGKYAAPFGAGTAPYDMFGDGRDGVMPSSGNLDNNNGFGAGQVVLGSQGYTSISVSDQYGVGRINPGDVVLIHQTQGVGAGNWELNKAVSDFTGGGTFVLEKPLQHTYSSQSGSDRAQILRVPQYSTCNVTGTVTPLAAWNGTWGGIFAVLCSGTMNVTGIVNGAGYGFRGGQAPPSDGDHGPGMQGEGELGYGVRSTARFGCAGGGGGGDDPGENHGGGGGGGAGHLNVGLNGSNGAGNIPGGTGGSTVGNIDLTLFSLGCGGGGGGPDDNDTQVGPGGIGGGIVFIAARTILVQGEIRANGSPGQNGRSSSGGGGGASGGAVLLRGQDVSIGNSLVRTLAGSGGSAVEDGGAGGSGSLGRIRVGYCDTFTGSNYPQESIEKLNCYIAEQVESSPYDRARLNLPASGANTYQVQYGRKLNWGGAANQVTSLRVPAGLFTAVTLQALVSDLPSNASFALDVGNTGSDSWNGTVANAGQYTSPNLAAFFNAYWASHGAPTTGYLDVPVRVYLDRAGQVLLTNLQATPTGSKVRTIRLPVRPQGYGNVTASFTVSDGSGPLAVGVDVGDNGSVEWTYTGSPTYPASLTSGNLATAVNAYLSGLSGEVDVPIRFTLAPFATINLTGFSATPVGQPDAQVGAGDIAFSATTPIETEPVTITTTLHNPGTLDSGGLTAAFYATLPNGQPQGLSLQIGSAYVSNIPTNGTTTTSIVWDTTGFTGTVPVRVVVDPYNRVAETNENNNEATADLTILTRPDLHTTQVALSNPEPVTGEAVTVTLTIHNAGGTAAGSQTVALYDGNPEGGGALIAAQGLASLAGGAATNLLFTWTPTTAGEHRLFARLDQDGQVNESDEGNNDTWADVYVGVAGPLLLDSGGANDPPYT